MTSMLRWTMPGRFDGRALTSDGDAVYRIDVGGPALSELQVGAALSLSGYVRLSPTATDVVLEPVLKETAGASEETSHGTALTLTGEWQRASVVHDVVQASANRITASFRISFTGQAFELDDVCLTVMGP